MVAQLELSPATRLANALLGDIDVHGVRGRRRINRLVSALTEWRIRLCEIARSPRGEGSGSYATGAPIRTSNCGGPGGEASGTCDPRTERLLPIDQVRAR